MSSARDVLANLLNEGAATQPQAATVVAADDSDQEATRQAALRQLDVEAATDMSGNRVAQIMGDSQTTQAAKMESIQRYLIAEGDDYGTATERFREFEAYLLSIQRDCVAVSKDAITRLMSDIKEAANPDIKQIVDNLGQVQSGIAQSTAMLEVMGKARREHGTIDTLKAAVVANDALIAEVGALKQREEDLEAASGSAAKRLEEEQLVAEKRKARAELELQVLVEKERQALADQVAAQGKLDAATQAEAATHQGAAKFTSLFGAGRAAA